MTVLTLDILTPIAAADAAAAGNLLALDGPALTGERTRSIRLDVLRGALARLGNVFMPTDPLYGAVGDGTTDDTTAWQNCITAAAGVTKGIVLMPPLPFKVTAPLSVTAPIIGMGRQSRFVTTADATVLTSGIDDLELGYFQISGNGKATSLASQLGINCDGKVRTRTRGVEFNGLSTGMRLATMPGGTTGLGGRVIDCDFLTCNIGFLSDVRGEYLAMSGCVFNANWTACRITGGNCRVVGCDLNANTVGVDLLPGTNDSHGIFSGCNINHNSIAVQTTTIQYGFTFAGCHSYGGYFYMHGGKAVMFRNCLLSPAGWQWYTTGGTTPNTAIEHCLFDLGYANTYDRQAGHAVRWLDNYDLTGAVVAGPA